jgi:hypothetical protein
LRAADGLTVVSAANSATARTGNYAQQSAGAVYHVCNGLDWIEGSKDI